MTEMTTILRLKIGEGELRVDDCQQYGIVKVFDQFFFKKIKQLGKGKFGEVWMCMEITKRVLTAVKYIKIKEAQDQEMKISNIASFLIEKEMMEKISLQSCTNIANFLGAYYLADSQGNIETLVLASESGDYSLKKLIKARQKKYQPEEALGFLAQISVGYKLLQELQIYHSDTKTANLVFSSSAGKFMIIDFGVSKLLQGTPGIDSNQFEVFQYANCGAKAYFSPEKKFYWDWKIPQPYPEHLKTFNPYKDDMWALGTCLERILGVKSKSYKGNVLLEHALKGLKQENPEKRFDALDLYRFVVDNDLHAFIESSGLISREQEVAESLNIARREKDGFEAVYDMLDDAIMHQEKLKVVKEEYQALLAKEGALTARNQILFVHVLGRLGEGV